MSQTAGNTVCPLPPDDRKAELVRRGITVSEIARRVGVTQGHVSNVIAGRRRAANVEQAIADAIGRPVAEVFGASEAAP